MEVSLLIGIWIYIHKVHQPIWMFSRRGSTSVQSNMKTAATAVSRSPIPNSGWPWNLFAFVLFNRVQKKMFFPPCLSCCPHRLREMPPPMRAKEFVGLLERIIKISFLSVRLAHSNRNCWNRPNYFDLRRPYQQNKQTNTWSDEHILRERARRFQIDRPTDRPSHLREKPTGSIWPALERLAFRHARWWNFGSRL